MGPLIPAAGIVIGLTGWALYKKKIKKIGEMTPEREAVFKEAMNNIEEPEKLRQLARVFAKEGLPHQADLLAKRARLRSLPDDVKKARKVIYQEALKLVDPQKVNEVADVFEQQGAIGAAQTLRQYASGLKPNIKIPSNYVATPAT